MTAARHIAMTLLLGAAAALPAAAIAADVDGGPVDFGFVFLPGGVEVTCKEPYGSADYSTVVRASDSYIDAPGRFRHGNAAFRFNVKNPGAAATLRVSKTFSRRKVDSDKWKTRISAECEMAAGATTNVVLRVPFVSDIDLAGSWDVSVKTGTDTETGALNLLYRSLYVHPSQMGRIVSNPVMAFRRWAMCVAVSPSVDTKNAARAYDNALRRLCGETAIVRENGKQRITHDMSIFKTDFSAIRDWRDLSVFDAVVIDVRDAAALPKGFMNGCGSPLDDWVASGGRLVLLRGQEPPKTDAMPWGLGEFVYQSEQPDWTAIAGALVRSAETQANAGLPAELPCDVAARQAVNAIKADTPFGSIVLVLLAFAAVAGPVLVLVLAKLGGRIHLLWLFPAIAVVFSAAVMAVLVSLKGVNPVLRQFAYTVVDEKAGRVVTVQNDVIVAPLPVAGDIVYPADCIIAYDSGDGRRAGEELVCAGGEWRFRRGWTPTLWPVVFRTVAVRPLSAISEGLRGRLDAAPCGTFVAEEAFGLVTLPIDGALGGREISHTVVRRSRQ